MRELVNIPKPLITVPKLEFDSLPHYQEAEISARKAREKVFKRHVHPNLIPVLEQLSNSPDETLFRQVLEAFRSIITTEKSINPLNLYMSVCWTDHLLWMMTDGAAVIYFQRVFNLTITDAAYEKARTRLELIKSPDSPITAKHIPKTPDKFSKIMSV